MSKKLLPTVRPLVLPPFLPSRVNWRWRHRSCPGRTKSDGSSSTHLLLGRLPARGGHPIRSCPPPHPTPVDSPVPVCIWYPRGKKGAGTGIFCSNQHRPRVPCGASILPESSSSCFRPSICATSSFRQMNVSVFRQAETQIGAGGPI